MDSTRLVGIASRRGTIREILMKFGTLTAMALAMALAAWVPASAETLLAGEQAADISAINGVISGDAEWELAWAGFKTADGMTGTPDGGLLFAQEQSNSIRKLGPAEIGRASCRDRVCQYV